MLYGLVLIVVMSMLVSIVAPSLNQNNGQVLQSQTTINGYKAANGFWEQRLDYDWSVLKTCSEEAVALKIGESAVLEYTIEVDRSIEESSDIFGVFGGVYVINNGLEPTENLTILDTVYYSLNGGESYIELTNAMVDTSAKPVLQSGESFTYAYQIPFEPVEGALYLNEASISITNTEQEPIITTDSFELPVTPTIISESDSQAELSDLFNVPDGWSIEVDDEGPWALEEGQSISIEVTVTNDEAAIGSTSELVNTASLIEMDTETQRTSTVTVDLSSIGGACINVTKTGPKCAWEGKTVVYTITVENCGDVDLQGVVVIDQMIGFLQEVPVLPVGAVLTWDIEYVIPDLPGCVINYCNIATASGWLFVNGEPFQFVYDEDEWCLRIWHPGMEIGKWTDCTLLPEGHAVTYYYTVENTGDSPLFNVKVYDDKLGWFLKADMEEGNGTLLSGDIWSFSTTTNIPVTEDIRPWTLCNVATAYGEICGGTWSVQTEWCIEVIDPRIEVTKWSPYTMIVDGHTIPYIINVTNTGNYPLSDVYITDSLMGNYYLIDYQADCILDPGETWTIELEYFVDPGDELEDVCNEVWAYGSVCHAWLEASAEWCVDVVHPCIDVTKWAEHEMLVEGHEVTYFINVTNCGDVDLENVRVYDDMMDMWFYLADYQADGTLAPGETWYLEVDYTIPLTDIMEPYQLCNLVTAYGDICHATVCDEAEWCITIVHPMIDIEKCCAYDMLLEGHVQEFKICVTNTGDVNLENVRVYDELLDTWFYLSDEVEEDGVLEPGESWCFSFCWEVPATEIREQYTIVNTATAFGDLCHASVNDTDCCSFVIVHPCICVQKTVDGPINGMIIEGHTVIFTVTVCNCGDVPLDDVKVYDDLLDTWFYYDAEAVDGVALCPPPLQEVGDTLYPGECWTFSYEYTVPETCLEEPWLLCNNVTAYGFLCHEYVTDTDSVCIEVVHPCICVTKWSPFTMAIEGHEVWWVVNVTNCGDVALDQVSVWDSWTEQWYLYDANINGTLLPGETWSFTISDTVPCTELDEPWCLENWVTAYGFLCHEWITCNDYWCIEIVHPCIDIQKTVDYEMIIEGHYVTWTITVTNCGDVALENVRVYDDLIDTWFYPCEDDEPRCVECDDILEPGEVWQFSFCYQIPCTELNEQYRICNTATVYADICHVTLEDNATACTTVVHPCISVTKWTPFDMAVEGHEVYWLINVTNCGDVALYDVMLDDYMYAGDEWIEWCWIFLSGQPGEDGVLQPGETWTFQLNYTVPETCIEVPWYLCNEVWAYGWLCHGAVWDDASSCIMIVHPDICVEKSCEPCVAVEGHPINFTVTVTNCGDVELQDVYFYDELLDQSFYKADYEADGSLAPGECWTLVLNWVVPEDDVDYQYCIRNVATAYGRVCHAWYEASDCCCVRVVHPCIDIEKWSPYTMIVEDHWIPYYLNVTNCGDVELYNVRVYDTMFGWLYLYDMIDDPDGVLMPGEWWNITLWYYVEPTDAVDVYSICNMATVYGDLCHATYTDFDCWCIEVYHPCIDIEKTADTGMTVEGHPVTYTITVTNCGDSMLHNVRVYDCMFGWFHLDAYQVDGTLNPGEVWQFSISYCVPDKDPCPEIWEICNTATVYGDFCHATLCDESTWCIKVVHPSIDIEKDVNCCSAEAGDTVVYTFSVTNTGDVALDNVTVEDERIGYLGVIGHLEPGQTVCLSTEWQVPCDLMDDPFCNLAVVKGYVITEWNCHEVMVSDSDCARLDIIHPRLTVLKFGPDQAAVGDIVLFSIWVQNTGDVPLYDVWLVDDGYVWYIGFLDIGKEKNRIAAFCISDCTPDPFCNVACAGGWYYDCPCDEWREVRNSGEWCVDIIHPCIDLEKSAPETAEAGSCITYTFTVTNCGDVPLTGVVIEDEMLGLSIYVGDLCVGETRTYTACYEVPYQDPCCDRCWEPEPDDSWTLTNKAVATGFYLSWKVCDKDCASTEVTIPQQCEN